MKWKAQLDNMKSSPFWKFAQVISPVFAAPFDSAQDERNSNRVITIEPATQLVLEDIYSCSAENSAEKVFLRSLVVIISEHANVTFVQKSTSSGDTQLFSSLQFIIKSHATLDIQIIHNGSENSCQKLWLDIVFEGQQAQATCRMGSILYDHAIFGVTSRQHHKISSSTSNLLVKSVNHSKSRFFYQGTIIIEQEAAQTKATQEAYSLLVDQEARASLLPELEIKTDDVQCRHGAAISSYNPDHLWYLTARGLSREEAKNLLIQSFLKSVL